MPLYAAIIASIGFVIVASTRQPVGFVLGTSILIVSVVMLIRAWRIPVRSHAILVASSFVTGILAVAAATAIIMSILR
jgi:hypothetical protein